MSVHAPPRKHTETQAKQKKYKHPKRVVDVEVEEFQGIVDTDAKGVEPLTRLPIYIPQWKGKVKVMKDWDTEKFTVSMPLLPEQVPFEGTRLARILLLKMKGYDLAYHTKFPHLVIEKYMQKFCYE